MGVSDEAKNVIPLKFLRKIKNKIFFPLVNSIIYILYISKLKFDIQIRISTIPSNWCLCVAFKTSLV
jgi:hypothetical protein